MRCARCNRRLTAEPTVISGRPYGPVCAARVQPKPKRERLFEIRAPRQQRRADETTIDWVAALAA
jgi:hypothetical protein